MKRLLTMMVLLLGCAPTDGPNYSYNTYFTIPLERGSSATVTEATPYWAELELSSHQTLFAPNHVWVEDVFPGQVTFGHWDAGVTIVLEGLEVSWIQEGDELCGGDSIGKASKLRVSAYWGWEEFTDQSDLSMIKVTDTEGRARLSDVSVGDKVFSLLRRGETDEGEHNVDRADCPYDWRE